MKFRILFALFNIVLFLAFLSIIFIPFFAVSPSFMLEFWKGNAAIPVFFAVCLVALNVLFVRNWPVLSLLEREDWPALSSYLEDAVLGKNRYNRRSIRLFLESHVLLGDFGPIDILSDKLSRARPALWRQFAPRFAAISILSGACGKAVETAEAALAARLSRRTREWCSFYVGLARYMEKDYSPAVTALLPLVRAGRDPLVVALSGYLCSVGAVRADEGNVALPVDGVPAAAAEARDRIAARFGKETWRRYLERERADIRIVILGKLTDQASSWLFSA